MGADQARHEAFLDGRPAVLIRIDALPGAHVLEARQAVLEKLALLRVRMPDGIDYMVGFDFSENLYALRNAPEYLTIDLDLPENATLEAISKIVRRCEKVVREQPGVQHTLCLSGTSIPEAISAATIVVSLEPAGQRREDRQAIAARVREQLEAQVKDAAIRLRDPSSRLPLADYPLCLGLCSKDFELVRGAGEGLLDQMKANPLLTDVHLSGAARKVQQISLEIDRTKAETLGVALGDIMPTIQAALGSVEVNEFQPGRRWSVQIESVGRDSLEKLEKIRVPGAKGVMVPLTAVATVRQQKQPSVIERLNGLPVVMIRATPAPGANTAAARKYMEAAAAGLVGCRVEWVGK
jgi:multidrug efflux pump subunit AcrB